MALWVFGYGSLIWKTGFPYDKKLVGYIKGYRPVFYQGSTYHRGTPEFPGRTATLEPADGEICCGIAYRISGEEDEKIALEHLEGREKQYDVKLHLDFYTDPTSTTPTLKDVMVYLASSDRKSNKNYLGPASMDEMARQIASAEGHSGPNKDYLFNLEDSLKEFDSHVMELADAVRKLLKA